MSMLERDGQHIGVVTKAFVNQVPPSSMIRRVLFITCMDPADTFLLSQRAGEGGAHGGHALPSSMSWSSVMIRMMLGRMLRRSL